jgi:1-acyl-sn-glycerol-3-phosphate acyltransferase
VTNHINILEAPVIYTRLSSRLVTGFSKTETWDNPFKAWLFNLWDVIPIRRGEPDRTAIRKGLKALQDGYLLAIAPEGTRSYHGKLQHGHPGVVMVALLSDVPILPVAHYGHENYKQKLRKLRRADFNIRVGKPFKLKRPSGKVTKEIRKKMTDEIMYQLAHLLPPGNRGVYSDISKASETYIDFKLNRVEAPNK